MQTTERRIWQKNHKRWSMIFTIWARRGNFEKSTESSVSNTQLRSCRQKHGSRLQYTRRQSAAKVRSCTLTHKTLSDSWMRWLLRSSSNLATIIYVARAGCTVILAKSCSTRDICTSVRSLMQSLISTAFCTTRRYSTNITLRQASFIPSSRITQSR